MKKYKVGIITIHRVLNYGTAWQVYSSVKLLQSLGFDVEVIDYIPERLKIANLKNFLFEVNPKYNNFLKKIIYLIVKIPTRLKEYLVFNNFIDNNIPLSGKKYYRLNEMFALEDEYDIFFTGSDQVWNYEEELQDTIDKVYFLGFISKEKRKFALSASFGRKSFSCDVLNDMGPLLNQYEGITVREKSGIDILSKLEYKDAIHSFDPTLLVDKSILISNASKRLYKEKYLLVYALSPNELIDKVAIYVANKLNIKILKLTNTLEHSDYVDKYFRFRKPEDFLSLFKFSEFIVTNSFHGTAFAVNFNKNFYTICAHKFEEREIDFLNSVGLLDRLINSIESIYNQNLEINFTDVNNIIDDNRKKVFSYLEEKLNNGKKIK